MKKSKYDEMMSVCWRDVLRCLEWALTVRQHEAERWIDDVEYDIDHIWPERLLYDTRKALACCELVIYHYELLNSVRWFLKYKPKTEEQLHLERCMRFYRDNKGKSPDSACLAANTEGGCRQ